MVSSTTFINVERSSCSDDGPFLNRLNFQSAYTPLMLWRKASSSTSPTSTCPNASEIPWGLSCAIGDASALVMSPRASVDIVPVSEVSLPSNGGDSSSSGASTCSKSEMSAGLCLGESSARRRARSLGEAGSERREPIG